jgi:hypothetical protein
VKDEGDSTEAIIMKLSGLLVSASVFLAAFLAAGSTFADPAYSQVLAQQPQCWDVRSNRLRDAIPGSISGSTGPSSRQTHQRSNGGSYPYGFPTC